MSSERITRELLLPELKFLKEVYRKNNRIFYCEKISEFEVCPKCATPAYTIYDHVTITVRDAPIRQKNIVLKIRKRRFLCKSCKKPFREPVNGIFKRFRTTQRLRGHIRWAAENYVLLVDSGNKKTTLRWLNFVFRWWTLCAARRTTHYEQLSFCFYYTFFC